jgi:hypothetical protein
MKRGKKAGNAQSLANSPAPSKSALKKAYGRAGGYYRGVEEVLQRIDQLHSPVQHTHTQFELALFTYLIVHLLIQNFNIYRTNFYNYNFYLLFLTVIILLKRLLLRYWRHVKWHNPLETSMSSPQVCLNIIIILVIVFNSLYLILQLFINHPFKNFLFLIYPFFAYYLLFGFRRPGKGTGIAGAGAAGGTDWFVHRVKELAYSCMECCYFAGLLPLRFLQHEYLYFDSVRCGLVIFYILANSFVMLLAHLLYTSFNELYIQSQLLGCWQTYTPPKHPLPSTSHSSPPHKFALTSHQTNSSDDGSEANSVHQDEGNGNGTMNGTGGSGHKHKKSLNAHSHITAISNTLSNYNTMNNNNLNNNSNNWEIGQHSSNKAKTGSVETTWSAHAVPYRQGALVVHKGKHYIALAPHNTAEPGLLIPRIIFLLLGRPERMHTCLILFQAVVVLSQVTLVFNSTSWNIYAVMLSFNYCILYLCIITRRVNLPLWHTLDLAQLQPTDSTKPQG